MTAVRKSGIVVPNRLPWRKRCAVSVLSYAVKLLMASWRTRWNNRDSEPVPGPAIFCIWHNRLGLVLSQHDHPFVSAKWPADGFAALVSASKDGAILTAALEEFDVQTIRGSSSRRGAQALLEATTWLERNRSVVITPDGPRGPCYKIQPGIIQLAQISGRPIIPLSSYNHHKIRVKSWDRFQIPLPFSRCDLRFGKPMYVSRDVSDEEREALRRQLEKTMLSLTED